MVLFEGPHRLLRTLRDLEATVGDRRVVVARELTKVHEEYVRGRLPESIDAFTRRPPRGECVIVLEGAGTRRSAGPSAAAPRDE